MTDPDRGAYTPQTDAPLSFDPRRPNERRPVPMTLVGSAVVLVVLIAGVALVYRGGVRGAGEGPRPVGEPIMSVKTAAPTPAREPESSGSLAEGGVNTLGSSSANRDAAVATNRATSTPAPGATETTRTITGASEAPSGPGPSGPPLQNASAQRSTRTASAASPPGASAGAPVFAPSPEQPAPRPPPRPRTVAALTPPAVTSRTTTSTSTTRTVATAGGSRADTLDPSDVAAAGMTSRAAPSAAKPAGRTVVAENDATPERHGPRVGMPRRDIQSSAAPSTVAHSAGVQSTGAQSIRVPASETATEGASITPGASVVQIGAFSSTALADRGFAEVASALPERMGGKAKHVQPLDHDGKTLFRTWVSGFASRADAVAFCEALKARSKICIVKS